MKRMWKEILSAAICFSAAVTLTAQPSVVPGQPPKAERPEPVVTFDSRKGEDTRRDAAARQAAVARKSSSSSSKSRSAEIRALAFSDNSLRVNRPMIIKTGKTDAKVREQLKEDLLVMCRILEKAAQEHISDHHKAAGIDLLALGGGNRSVRTMYLEDYGVIFTLNVRIPLLSDAKVEEPEVKETTRNEEWEETRNELFGQKRRIKRVHPGHSPSYDEEDVQDLKKELLNALKNAANIRNLKPTDWITVAVNGPGFLETEVFQVERIRGEDPEKPGAPRVEFSPRAQFFSTDESQAGGESMMILRIGKTQLDDLVKKANGSGEELMQELEKVVSVSLY